MLFLASILSLGHTAYIVRDKSRALHGDNCNTNLTASAICYHCGELDVSVFQEVHEKCCLDEDDYRSLCTLWYTEEPKRGRRNRGWY
nr:hypothetical protein BaRGS_033058 [Batillaria attramentaria]